MCKENWSFLISFVHTKEMCSNLKTMFGNKLFLEYILSIWILNCTLDKWDTVIHIAYGWEGIWCAKEGKRKKYITLKLQISLHDSLLRFYHYYLFILNKGRNSWISIRLFVLVKYNNFNIMYMQTLLFN